jgi:hypothetical protein
MAHKPKTADGRLDAGGIEAICQLLRCHLRSWQIAGTLRVQGTPNSIGNWVIEGNRHVSTAFGDSAQKLTQRVSLKRGIFEVDVLLWQQFVSTL